MKEWFMINCEIYFIKYRICVSLCVRVFVCVCARLCVVCFFYLTNMFIYTIFYSSSSRFKLMIAYSSSSPARAYVYFGQQKKTKKNKMQRNTYTTGTNITFTSTEFLSQTIVRISTGDLTWPSHWDIWHFINTDATYSNLIRVELVDGGCNTSKDSSKESELTSSLVRTVSMKIRCPNTHNFIFFVNLHIEWCWVHVFSWSYSYWILQAHQSYAYLEGRPNQKDLWFVHWYEASWGNHQFEDRIQLHQCSRWIEDELKWWQ